MPTRQLEHHEVHNNHKTFPIVVLCHDINSPENIGMTFRISEAMGVEKIYLSGNTPTPENKKVQKTSRSTEKYIPYSYQSNVIPLLQKLKDEGYTLIALEVTNDSKVLSSVDFCMYKKIALIPGNEQNGVSPEILELIDLSVEIPMYGKNTSINVVNATSIALYEITKQFNR